MVQDSFNFEEIDHQHDSSSHLDYGCVPILPNLPVSNNDSGHEMDEIVTSLAASETVIQNNVQPIQDEEQQV